jgi:hypothetical protein
VHRTDENEGPSKTHEKVSRNIRIKSCPLTQFSKEILSDPRPNNNVPTAKKMDPAIAVTLGP